MVYKHEEMLATEVKMKKHENVCFRGTINKSIIMLENDNKFIKISKNRLKQKELEKTIENIENKSEKIKKQKYIKKQKELEKTEILDLDGIEKTEIIPTISIEEFGNLKKEKKDKKFISNKSRFNFFKKIKNWNELRKQESLKTIEIRKAKKEKTNELKNKIKLEKEAKKLKGEFDYSNINNESNFSQAKKLEKEAKKKLRIEEKNRIKLEKEKQNQIKEEERKEKLRKKIEEETLRKKEKEKKTLAIIKERREKNAKIKKEKDQARKERKEKAILIKKAQEESKLKEKKERKNFKEKLENWYNNLSFIKDRQNRREMQRQTLLIDFEGADAVRSEEKVVYKYVAKNLDTGKVENGYFAAFSKLDVHSFLIAEGYEVYEITPQSGVISNLGKFSSKFKAAELDFFLTQLSTFLKSGITLVEAVKILSKQNNRQNHKQVYKAIIYELTMGENFSDALSKQGSVFPRLLINMVKTSELTGDLPETLDDMADYYKETEKTRKQMISAITYPLVILVFAISILIFIMVSVIPQFVDIYGDLGTDLPKITVITIGISKFLQSNWFYLILGMLVFILLFFIIFKTIKVFRTVIQSLLMNTPVFGKIIIYNEVTMFTKTFASLLNHNVYITDCMEVLSKITNNEVYKMLIFDTITNLAKGEAISNSFKNHWAFPSIAYEMILTGEKTGQLGEMMDKVAQYYQEQHKNAVNQIKAFIEPVLIVILATIVGVVLLSVVLPMFDMYQNIG